ncbi:hypothetical protein HGB13_02085 [bacterium]|nr:hypothetical protein [bacterium]
MAKLYYDEAPLANNLINKDLQGNTISSGWVNDDAPISLNFITAATVAGTITPEVVVKSVDLGQPAPSFSQNDAATTTNITINTGTASIADEQINVSANLTGLIGQKTYYWKARYSDAAGVVSPWSSLTGSFSVDTQGLISTDIEINNDNWATKTSSVILNLSADDGLGSGVAQMRLSNNGSNWSDWETFSVTKEWDITAATYGGNSNEEEKKVYAEFKDAVGNVAGITKTTTADFNGTLGSGLSNTDDELKLSAQPIQATINSHIESGYWQEPSTDQYTPVFTYPGSTQLRVNYTVAGDGNYVNGGSALNFFPTSIQTTTNGTFTTNWISSSQVQGSVDGPLSDYVALDINWIEYQSTQFANTSPLNQYSAIIDRNTDETKEINSIDWNSLSPAGTSITAQVMASNSVDATGGMGLTSISRGQNFTSLPGWQNYRYVKFVLTFNTNVERNATPIIQDINIGYASIDKIIYDKTAPVLGANTVITPAIDSDILGGQNFNITWDENEISDTLAGLATNPIKIEYTLNGADFNVLSDNESNDGTYSWAVPSWNEPVVQLRISATDRANNTITAITGAFSVDSSAPTGSAGSLNAYYKTSSIDVPYTANDSISGVSHVRLYYTTNNGVNWTAFGDNFTTSPIIFTGATTNTYGFKVIANDRVGLKDETDPPISGTLPEVTTIVDRDLPTISVDQTGGYGGVDRQWPNEISGAVSDLGGSGLNNVDVKLYENGNYWDGSGWLAEEYTIEAVVVGSVWSIPLVQANLENDKQYSVAVSAYDNATNVRSSTSVFYIDTLPPNSGSVSINDDNPDYINSAVSNVKLVFNNVDFDVRSTPTYTGTNGGLRISNDGVFDIEEWESFDTQNPVRDNWSIAAGNGVKTIYVQFRDESGNISNIEIKDSVTIDTVKPVITITTPTSGGVFNSIAAISGTAQEATGGFSSASKFQFQITKVQDSVTLYWSASSGWTDVPTWVNANGYGGAAPNFTWTRTSNLPDDWSTEIEYDYSIKARATDNAGNQSDEVSFNFKFDKIAPQVSSLTSSTHPDQANTFWYQNKRPMVSWGASDTNGISEYRYVLDNSQDTILNDSTTGTTTVNNTVTSKSYLTDLDDGQWWFHVQSKDSAGNWGLTSSYVFRIDNTGPAVSNTFAANGIDDTKVELSWTSYTDAGAGVKEYKIYRSSAKNAPEANSGINPLTLTYSESNLVGTFTHTDSINNPTFIDEGLTEGWYYYAMYATDKTDVTNQSALAYSHSKTNFIPDAINLKVNNNSSEVVFNPSDARTLSLAWDTVDKDSATDIINTKVTIKKPDGLDLISFNQSDTSRMNRVAIANGYRITANYTIPATENYGSYKVFVTTSDTINSSRHILDSNIITVKINPDIVGSQLATGYSSTQINLSWQGPSLAGASTKYEIYRSLVADSNNSAWNNPIATNIDGLTYENTGLEADTLYFYKIKTIEKDKDSEASDLRSVFSPTFSVTTPTPASASNMQLKDVSATTSGQASFRLFLWWDAPIATEGTTLNGVPAEPTYVVTRSVDGFYDPTPILETTEKYLLDIDLDSNKFYTYRIQTKDINNKLTSTQKAVASSAVKPGGVPIVTNNNPAPAVSTLTINWDTNIPVETRVMFGTESGNYTKEEGLTGERSDHNITIKGLKPSTTYFYKVIAVNPASGLEATINEQSVTTNPFEITGLNAATTKTQAKITWKTNIDSDTRVEYRREGSSSPSELSGDKDMTTNHSHLLTDLTPGVYSYLVRSQDADGNMVESALGRFELSESGPGAFGVPQAAKVDEKEITATSAKITWTSTITTSSWVDYGTAPGSYSVSVGDDNLTTNHIVTLQNLAADTQYYYRIRGLDAAGEEYVSEEYKFKALAQPTIDNIKVLNIGPYSATIKYSTNIKTDTGVNYGVDTNYGKRSQSQDMVTEHEIVLTDLVDNQDYHFQVDVKDQAGNSVRSVDQVFKTPLDATPPKISDVKLSPLSGSDSSKRGIIITWTTDKESSSQVAYSSGIAAGSYNQKSPEDPSMTLSHTVVINSLDPGTTYHFQLLSKDKRGNLAQSPDYTMLTQEQEESVLNLIINTLQETFSWVGKVGNWFSTTFGKLFSR